MGVLVTFFQCGLTHCEDTASRCLFSLRVTTPDLEMIHVSSALKLVLSGSKYPVGHIDKFMHIGLDGSHPSSYMALMFS